VTSVRKFLIGKHLLFVERLCCIHLATGVIFSTLYIFNSITLHQNATLLINFSTHFNVVLLCYTYINIMKHLYNYHYFIVLLIGKNLTLPNQIGMLVYLFFWWTYACVFNHNNKCGLLFNYLISVYCGCNIFCSLNQSQ
jgi:hypothetical protein